MERKPNFKSSLIWISGDAFVQVMKATLKGVAHDLSLEIVVLNKFNFSINKIEYEVNFYDSSETKLNETPYKVDGENIEIKPNEMSLASKLKITDLYPEARRAEVKLLKAFFEDGNNVDLTYENMERYVCDDIDPGNLTILREVAGEDALCLSIKLENNWRCVCGYFNGDDSNFCNNCRREKEKVLKDYQSIQHIKEQLDKEINENLGEIDVSSQDVELDDDYDDVYEESENKKVEIKIKKEIIEDSKKEMKDFFEKVPKGSFFLLFFSSVMLISSIMLTLVLK